MRIALALIIVLLLVAGLAYIMSSGNDVSDEMLADAESFLAIGDHVSAIETCDVYLAANPDSSQAHLIRGRALLGAQRTRQDFQDAREDFAAAVKAAPDSIDAKAELSDLTLRLGRLSEAEPLTRDVLELQPTNARALSNMWLILQLQGRVEELKPLFVASAGSDDFTPVTLLTMADPIAAPLPPSVHSLMRTCMVTVPDDPLPMLGRARELILSNKPKEALQILMDACQKHPEKSTAHGLLGMALLQVGSTEDIANWLNNLPNDKESDARIWWVRGKLAERTKLPKAAARCFWESVKRNPTNRVAAYDLGQTLSVTGSHKNAARELSQYAADLAELGTTAFEAGPNEPSKIKAVVSKLEHFGRLHEARAWCIAATRLPELQAWAQSKRETLSDQLGTNSSFMLASANPANKLDLSDWPVPTKLDLSKAQPALSISTDTTMSVVTFEDQAKSKGIDFTFHTPLNGRASMHEFSGGGASVIDFDRDGWPDTFLTQGATFPERPGAKVRIDKLYRNIGGDHFVEVGDDATVGDTRYGQGAAIGDLDNDGFPDIFVGNIGPNALFHNNGDGTFSRVELADEIAGDAWTIGAFVADLNSDSIPDIYALNYLGGDDVFTRECLVDGQHIQCSPAYFPAAADHVLFGDGSSGLVDATASSKLATDDGKGMGVVAFRMQGDNQTSVLIANDTEPNYLFRADNGQFEETGMLSGIALGSTGQAQSCMGIASGDINNDGAIDFLVTNFTVEANNLFIQNDGFFDDEIDASGLRDDGFSVMGWGAQFLDADLDGNLDLLIANGHLEARGRTRSKMPTHFFRNTGGRFRLEKPKRLGPYFSKDFFGRAVATLDWNRDGLPDALVTHRRDPIALLTNTTEEHGDCIRVRLVGTESARDAVGTVVEVTTNKRTLTRQVTAGDGFQASNEKVLNFGIRRDETIQSLTVIWASGRTAVYEAPKKNTVVTLVEGDDRMFAIE